MNVSRIPLKLATAFFRNLVFLFRRVMSLANDPDGKPLIVFDVATVGLQEHFDPVVQWLLANGRSQLLIVIPDSEWGDYEPLDSTQQRKADWFCMTQTDFRFMPFRPAVTVSFHPETGSRLHPLFWRRDSKRVTRIVMQHGLSDKAAFGDIGKKDPLSDFDVVFLAGPVFREGSLREYETKYPETYRRLTFREIGSPKTDPLFQPFLDRDSMLADLGLDPLLKTVCYAPTWERCASLEQQGVEIIEALATLDVNVLVKLHHASLDQHGYDFVLQNGHGGKDWRRVMKQLEAHHQNVKLAPGRNATPYFRVSDLLVSDVSGAAFEFVLQDKPVVFFDVPQVFVMYGTKGIHYFGRQCGDIVSGIDELCEVVKINLADPDRRRAERQEWISRISYSRGDATQRAGETILSFALSRQNRI